MMAKKRKRADQVRRALEEAFSKDDFSEKEAVFTILDENGVITLKGKARSQKIKTRLEKIAGEQPGVVSVINEMDVEDPITADGIDYEVHIPPVRRPFGHT
jgi:osmotically-inducible protein OsmY